MYLEPRGLDSTLRDNNQDSGENPGQVYTRWKSSTGNNIFTTGSYNPLNHQENQIQV